MIIDTSRVKGVIFDIDGTLLDSMPVWDGVSARFLRSIGVEPEPDLSEKLFTVTVNEGVEYIKNHYKLDLTPSEIRQGTLNLIKNDYYYNVPPRKGAVELIKQLADANIKMALATTGDRELATAALKRLGLYDYFEVLLTCNEYNSNKSEPLIFFETAKALNDNKAIDDSSEYIIVEDSIKAVRTGVNAGFKVIAIEDKASDYTWDELKNTADYYIHELDEISVI